MANRIGPNHYLFFDFLCYRLQWLHFLNQNTEEFLTPQLNHLLATDHPQLETLLRDLPVAIFLNTLQDEIFEYELKTIELISKQSPSILDNYLQSSEFWGRQLSLKLQKNYTKHSLSELYDFLFLYLCGGPISATPPLIVKRRILSELQYETKLCAHRRYPTESQMLAHLACQLEAAVFKGFAKAFLWNIHFERKYKKTHCSDHFRVSSNPDV